MSRHAIRRTLVVGCMLCVAAIAFLIWADLNRRVTQATALRARPGTSLAEVERVFGGPGASVVFQEDPGRPDLLVVVLNCPGRRWVPAELVRDPSMTWRVWPGYETLWVVRFKDGAVVEMFGAGNPGLLTRVRGLVPWPARGGGGTTRVSPPAPRE